MNNITETALGETFIAGDVNQVGLALALTREEALVVDAALIHAIGDGVLDGYASTGIAIGVSDRLEALGYFTEDDAAELLLGVIDPSEASDDGFPSEFYEDKSDPDASEDDESLADLFAFLELLFYGEEEDDEDDPHLPEDDEDENDLDADALAESFQNALTELRAFLEPILPAGEDEDYEDDPEDENGGYCDCEVCQGDLDEDSEGDPEAEPIEINPYGPALTDGRLWDAYFGSRL